MRLILIRHAEAEDYAESDFERRLTPKGRKQAGAAGKFLKMLHMSGETVIVHSPYCRAKETADIIAQRLFAEISLIEEKRVGCGMRVENAGDVINELFSFDNLILVGHQPDLGELFCFLIGGHGSMYSFNKACTAIFQLQRFGHASGALEAFIPVKLLINRNIH